MNPKEKSLREILEKIFLRTLGESVAFYNKRITQALFAIQAHYTDKLLYSYGYNKGYTDGLKGKARQLSEEEIINLLDKPKFRVYRHPLTLKEIAHAIFKAQEKNK